MTKRRNQGLILLALSVPIMWWGFNQFIYGSGHSALEAIAVSLSCTLGSLFAISGLVMLVTKNSLGIWKVTNPDDKKGKTFDELTSAEKDARIASIEKEKARI